MATYPNKFLRLNNSYIDSKDIYDNEVCMTIIADTGHRDSEAETNARFSRREND
jgi:hypothetical protein